MFDFRNRETPEEFNRQKRIFEFCDMKCDMFNDKFINRILRDMWNMDFEALKIDCRDMYRIFYRLQEKVLYKVKIMEWLIVTYLDYCDRNGKDIRKIINSMQRDICKEADKAEVFGLMNESDMLHDIFIYFTSKLRHTKEPERNKNEYVKCEINTYELNDKEIDKILDFLD